MLRVRWERVGRFALLVTFAIVIGLYADHAVSYLKTRAQADRQRAIVSQLRHENAGLRRSLSSLSDARTIIRDARALGMIRQGEQAYAITGSGAP